MFCPFINGECRKDCAFRHMARAAVGGMTNNLMFCALAIAADDLVTYLPQKELQEEDHIS